MAKTSTKQVGVVKLHDVSYTSSDYIRQKVAAEMAGLYSVFKVRTVGGKDVRTSQTKSSGKLKKQHAEMAEG